EESSSSASMAPLVAMIALTPHTAEPTASSVVSLGLRLNSLPRNVMNASEPAISMATRTRLTPPSFKMSPSRKREPSSTIPAFSQNSYVATPVRKISGMPTEEHTSELQSPCNLVCRLLLEKKKKKHK